MPGPKISKSKEPTFYAAVMINTHESADQSTLVLNGMQDGLIDYAPSFTAAADVAAEEATKWGGSYVICEIKPLERRDYPAVPEDDE